MTEQGLQPFLHEVFHDARRDMAKQRIVERNEASASSPASHASVDESLAHIQGKESIEDGTRTHAELLVSSGVVVISRLRQ